MTRGFARWTLLSWRRLVWSTSAPGRMARLEKVLGQFCSHFISFASACPSDLCVAGQVVGVSLVPVHPSPPRSSGNILPQRLWHHSRCPCLHRLHLPCPRRFLAVVVAQSFRQELTPACTPVLRLWVRRVVVLPDHQLLCVLIVALARPNGCLSSRLIISSASGRFALIPNSMRVRHGLVCILFGVPCLLASHPRHPSV